ncbi:MAG: hypothetical protein JEZ11_22445 [Desulfobacterales bacterium]|nr:hypothetical protein [Desulfobacterales bacterium]
MTVQPDLDHAERQFLYRVFQAASGNPDVQVDMYAVGQVGGLEQDAARRMAETLIGWELVDIRTLAGGISITSQGLAFLDQAGMVAEPEPAGEALSPGPTLDNTDRRRIERLSTDLKARAGERSWHFSALNEFMADLRTLEAQLSSPRPKTDVIRACLHSIADNLTEAGSRENLTRVRLLLG